MTETKINYDRDADVPYVSFGCSAHVAGVELADNLLLRLDTGKATGSAPRAIGLTFISFSRLMAAQQQQLVTYCFSAKTQILCQSVSHVA